MDYYLEFIDDLHFAFSDEFHKGQKIEDIVTFLSSSPELSRKEYYSYIFNLCCLCLGHIVPELPIVSLGSPDRISSAIYLADVIEPLQSYLLTCNTEQKVFSGAGSISLCGEMSAEFRDKTLQPSYDLWANSDFHGRSKIYADLTKTYKDVRVAANVETDAVVTLSSGSPEKRLPQKKRPAQRPRIDLSKTSTAVAAKTCISKLRSSGAGTSGECS